MAAGGLALLVRGVSNDPMMGLERRREFYTSG
jgi:hypothetical protein